MPYERQVEGDIIEVGYDEARLVDPHGHLFKPLHCRQHGAGCCGQAGCCLHVAREAPEGSEGQ